MDRIFVINFSAMHQSMSCMVEEVMESLRRDEYIRYGDIITCRDCQFEIHSEEYGYIRVDFVRGVSCED